MNNIYKVIWSKAKNCYVVASEIAKSHTKSASGQSVRRSALASLLALSLLCGGLGVASAVDVVHVDESATGTAEVYTKTGVDTLLNDKADKTALGNKADATDVVKNTTNIATNKENIAQLDTKKLDKEVANSTFATKDALNDLKDVVNNKVDESVVEAALDGKANTSLDNLSDAGKSVIKDTMAGELAKKADVTALDGKADKTYVDQKLTEAGTNVDAKLAGYAKTEDVNAELGKKANQSDLDTANAEITHLQTKTTGLSDDGKSLTGMNNVETGALNVTGEIKNGAGVTTTLTAIDASMKQTDTNKADIATNKANIANLQTTTNEQQTAIDGLNAKTTKITYDAALGTSVDGVTFNAGAVTGVTSINGTEIGTKESGSYIFQDASIWGNMKNVDTQVKTNAENIEKNKTDITNLDNKVGTVGTGTYLDTTKSVGENLGLLDAGLKKEVDDRTAAVEAEKTAREAEDNKLSDRIGTVAVNGNYIEKDKSVSDNLVKLDAQAKTNADAIKATNDRTGGIARNTEGTQTTIEGIVKVDNQGNVKDVKNLSAETITTTGDAAIGGALGVTGATTLNGALTANGDATFKEKVTVEKDLTVNGKLNVGEIYLKNDKLESTGKKHDSATSITADGISNLAKVTEHGNTTESQFTHNEKGTFNHAKDGSTTDWKESTSNVTADGVANVAKDSKGNNNTFTQTSTDTKNILTDKDGNTSTTRQDGKGIYGYAKDKDGNKSYTKQEGNRIAESVIGKDGTETKSEMTSTDITNTAKDGTITNDAKDIVNNATGDMTNTVGGNLTTTVGGNEIHDVKGTKTETVEGKVTENFKGGQETNVTGDQTTNVSGTQTTNATDINRNASSGMIDKVDNAYGTNTETKVAGKTTTEVSIKGTGETAGYIRGATESRDYLIKGTLKNSESKTAETTSTKITDGNGKISSTIQDVTQISGSVTDGTNTSVSNVKADSIDSSVTGGTSISTINQRKDSITSQVTDGTTITKTEQTAKDITNTAKDGTITNDAKDIVNKASGDMTNTVGGDLSTTVGGNELHEVTGTKTENVTGKVTENYGNGQETNVTGNQDIHVTGKQTNKIDGDQENTIGGNQTTTVTGDISNKAENITNEANTKLTDKVGEHTRVLDGEGITDTVGGSTFKQRIDAIMMESKNVSIKAGETLTNEAKVITNKASEVINNEAININNTATGIITSKASEIKNEANQLISNKVGENTWENMEDGKITTSIKNGTKQNLTQSDAEKTEHSVVNGSNSTVNKQTSEEITDAVTNGTTTNMTQNTATSSNNTIADTNGNANTVVSTVDGTKFTNTGANTAIGEGTVTDTTIKGNTITTGKVTMDYAEVMKDLGVRGNANIAGKTTTGELEVTGKSTLKSDVTMESNATVKKDLTVEGTTTTKTLHVTENATVGGTLDVAKKATFGDSVSIAKDLSVGGNATITGDVTASSYKVGDKTYISAAGINANDQKITNVADGSISEGSKDAVNGGQLYTVKNDLDGKVNKVGANAAAMANLHPMEFDPDSKWNIAAAIGNYGSETAAALGAFYRPNDDVMVNLSTAFGTGENMVGGGVSVRLGNGGNKLSREETNALKAQVADLTARMDALLSVLNPNMSKDFPDVPENHWAYEAVSRLAGNDIVQGYPDGEFHGERTMTRYEMAEIIYNALSRGAEAEKELVEEFKPELQAMAASEKATAERAEG